MANLSDAWGTITVENVGQEFLDFLKEVEDKDAYYTLVGSYILEDLKPDKHNDLYFDFGNSGRWAFSNNLRGYLGGEWLGEYQDAYNKFLKAIEKKDGFVLVEYKDCDPSMGWMGEGETQLDAGGLSGNWHDEEITVAKFAAFQGEDETWALSYLSGEEAADEYAKYKEECKNKKEEPVSADEWRETIYEDTL